MHPLYFMNIVIAGLNQCIIARDKHKQAYLLQFVICDLLVCMSLLHVVAISLIVVWCACSWIYSHC